MLDSDFYKSQGYNELQNLIFAIVDCRGHFNHDKGYYKIEDAKQARDNFNKSLEALKEFPMYIDCYMPRDSMDKTFRIIVLELPSLDRDILKLFFDGKYSQMYTQEEIKSFKNPQIDHKEKLNWETHKAVLEHKAHIKSEFKRLLKDKYGTDIPLDEIPDDSEFDIPAKVEIEKEVIYKDIDALYLIGLKQFEVEV
jgi:hypothetical protein